MKGEELKLLSPTLRITQFGTIQLLTIVSSLIIMILSFYYLLNKNTEDQKIIKKWKKGTKEIPESSLRLLRLFLNGDASALLGDEWKGYRFVENLIYVPEWCKGLHHMRLEHFSGNASELGAYSKKSIC